MPTKKDLLSDFSCFLLLKPTAEVVKDLAGVPRAQSNSLAKTHFQKARTQGEPHIAFNALFGVPSVAARLTTPSEHDSLEDSDDEDVVPPVSEKGKGKVSTLLPHKVRVPSSIFTLSFLTFLVAAPLQPLQRGICAQEAAVQVQGQA